MIFNPILYIKGGQNINLSSINIEQEDVVKDKKFITSTGEYKNGTLVRITDYYNGTIQGTPIQHSVLSSEESIVYQKITFLKGGYFRTNDQITFSHYIPNYQNISKVYSYIGDVQNNNNTEPLTIELRTPDNNTVIASNVVSPNGQILEFKFIDRSPFHSKVKYYTSGSYVEIEESSIDSVIMEDNTIHVIHKFKCSIF